MKKEDPAAGIVQLFNPKRQLEALPYMETGVVLSPMPNLTVKTRDLEYQKEKIKLNEYWLKGHKRKVKIHSAPFIGSDSRGDAHISGGFPETEIEYLDELKAGDLVMCLQSQDKQTLYVLCRLVDLGGGK